MPVLNAPIRVLGCGSPLMGDDGVGLKVIEALKKTELNELKTLDIEDAGVCGLDLLNLLDGAKKVIIVDAVISGSEPGLVFRIEGSDLIEGTASHDVISAHDMGISDVLKIGQEVQELPEVVVIGIEIGKPVNGLSMELSPAVARAVKKAVRAIKEEVLASL
ncbi:MAG: hydrogenase maturation protease [Methanosarcinaceae archaeon]|nr:hydrogenase maturation protease [Methanosarcinaceae archaeon]MDD4332138.1 hydrogenase maturation protease [Methanosarcinaceae archaeon]MDD4749239.1 hydrogenase maturation protease [Methanosarcinaceae archaeon]